MSQHPDQIEHVVGLTAERAVVDRRQVVGDTVRVETVTRAHVHSVDEVLTDETVTVEHVPIGRQIEVAPNIVQDGDLTIIPVVVEEVVVTRRLVLKEEIHLRRVRTQRLHQEDVVLRKQEAVVTRQPVEDDPNNQPL